MTTTMNSLALSIRMAALALAAAFLAASCSKNTPPPQPAPGARPTTTPAPAPKASPPVLIEPTTGVGKVRFGMAPEEVAAALGEPKSKTEVRDSKGQKGGETWSYPQDGLSVAFNQPPNKNEAVFQIRCLSSFVGVTRQGVGIGSTKAEVIQAFGSPNQDNSPLPDREALVYNSLGIAFTVANDKVNEIAMHRVATH